MVWPASSSPPYVKSQAMAPHYNKISTELIIAMDLFAKDSSAHPWPVSVTS